MFSGGLSISDINIKTATKRMPELIIKEPIMYFILITMIGCNLFTAT
jgi:hypothetical protein